MSNPVSNHSDRKLSHLSLFLARVYGIRNTFSTKHSHYIEVLKFVVTSIINNCDDGKKEKLVLIY